MDKPKTRPTRGVAVLGILALAFLIASRTTGAGWLTVLTAIGLGLIGTGLVGPRLAMRGIELDVTAPTDAVAGRPFDVSISVTGPTQYLRIRATKPGSDWLGIRVPTAGAFRVTAERRGVIKHVELQISTAAPIGLAWASRRVEVPLTKPIAVAPRVEMVRSTSPVTSPSRGTESQGERAGMGETVRSIRDYQHGDPLRMIHWPATARMDSPVVKELEAPDAPILIVRLDLNCADSEADVRAEIAYGHIQRGLAAGLPVRLLTAEASGPHAGRVGSMLEAGRRLAYASAGHPGEPPVDESPSTLVSVP